MWTVIKTFAKTGLASIPGGQFVIMGFEFIVRYWKPLAIVAAIAISFHQGVKHERKKNHTAQLAAQLLKVTFERDNLKKAGELANSQIADLEKRVQANDQLVQDLRDRPAAGDCPLSSDALRRLRRIGD